MRSPCASLRPGSTPTWNSPVRASAATRRGRPPGLRVREPTVACRLPMAPFSRVLSLCGAAVVVATATAQQLQFEPFRFAGQPLILQPMPPGSVGLPLCGDVDGDGRNDLVIVSDAGLSVDYAIGDGS